MSLTRDVMNSNRDVYLEKACKQTYWTEWYYSKFNVSPVKMKMMIRENFNLLLIEKQPFISVRINIV